ncbi:MAG: RecX family transcriptional regulator [Candidatus Cloacimonetes bacterium]|nr:RecX family transcriptional regulator [Candidatus Cloacimonadota bacterium]
MKIRIKSKTKTIFIVYADSEIWGILPLKILQIFSIYPGKETIISKEQAKELLLEIEKFAWDKLLNFLTYRERSCGEAKSYLKQLPLKNSIYEKLVTKAISADFINDRRFTEFYIEDLIEKSKNEKEIKQKLFEKHIPEVMIKSMLLELFTPQKKEEVLIKNIEKALARFIRYKGRERKEKILNYLSRKGFSYGEVKEKLEEYK